jgi:hypothetical protein
MMMRAKTCMNSTSRGPNSSRRRLLSAHSVPYRCPSEKLSGTEQKAPMSSASVTGMAAAIGFARTSRRRKIGIASCAI